MNPGWPGRRQSSVGWGGGRDGIGAASAPERLGLKMGTIAPRWSRTCARPRARHDGLQECAHREPRATCEAAIDWLRKKGLSKAAKKAGRVAADGLDRRHAIEGNKGVDGRGEFRDRLRRAQRPVPGAGATIIADGVAYGADVEAIKAAKAGGGLVADASLRAIATIGENITLRRAAMDRSGKEGGCRLLHAQRHRRRYWKNRCAGGASNLQGQCPTR